MIEFFLKEDEKKGEWNDRKQVGLTLLEDARKITKDNKIVERIRILEEIWNLPEEGPAWLKF
jgi:hypothetical protein